MAINKIKNRIEFTDYCLRKLGEPVIEVNVAEEQVEDCIDDALDMFWEYHADGSTQTYHKHQITQIELDQGYFILPTKILSCIRILSLGGGGANGIANIGGNLQMFSYFSDLISRIPGNGLGTYYMNMSYLSMVNDTFNAEKMFEYNKHQDRFMILGSGDTIKAGQYVVVEVVTANDPKDYPETWNNWWLKKYTTETIKKQWGINLGKYQNVTLPSGMTLNGEAIRSEADSEIKDLEQRLRDEFQLPPDFFMG